MFCASSHQTTILQSKFPTAPGFPRQPGLALILASFSQTMMIETASSKWNEGFQGREGHFIGNGGRIAAGRSCRLSGLDDGIRRFVQADEVPLAVGIGDDEPQRVGGGQSVERPEAQRGGLDASVIVVSGDCLAGRRAHELHLCRRGEHLHGDGGKAFQVAVALDHLTGHIGDREDAREGLA